jgi:hypothetical protein
VALGAGADELLLAEVRVSGFLRLRLLLEPRFELAGGDDLDRGQHLGVLDPAELRALALEDAGSLRLEGRLDSLAGNGIELAADPGHPVAVDDVALRRRDLEDDETVLRRPEAIDGDHAVGIPVLPVELAALDSDPQVTGPRLVLEGDSRELVEGERRDDQEDHDWHERPADLQARRAVDLGALDRPVAATAAVADDEQRQGHGDGQEHDRRPEGDEPVEIRDAFGVR